MATWRCTTCGAQVSTKVDKPALAARFCDKCKSGTNRKPSDPTDADKPAKSPKKKTVKS